MNLLASLLVLFSLNFMKSNDLSQRNLSPQLIKSKLIQSGIDSSEVELLDNKSVSLIPRSKGLHYYSAYIINDLTGNWLSVSKTEYDSRLKTKAHVGEKTQSDFYDEYMRIGLIVNDLGEANYHFIAYAIWDRMPFCRTTDSFSISGDGIIPVFGSSIGYVTDLLTTRVSTKSKSARKETERFDIAKEKIQLLDSGNNSGVGFLYTLPKNKTVFTLDYMYSDLSFYLSFDAKLHFPGLTQNFNVQATYDHYEQVIQFTPTLTFSSINGFFGLGLSTTWNNHRRCATTKKPIHYEA